MCLLEGEKEITSDNDILSEVIFMGKYYTYLNSNPYLPYFLLATLKFNYSPSKGCFKNL